MRSGAQTLLLLSTHLDCQVLRALSDGPRRQIELRHATGSPAQSTLRARLRRLAEAGVIERHRQGQLPGVVEYNLSRAGRDLLVVAEVLERWLEGAPAGPLPLGSSAAKAAIRALTEGWSKAIFRALAAQPLTLTELDGVIGSLSYPSLDRRLRSLRLAGLVKAHPGNVRGTPYAVTPWTRRAAGPLTAAARWEMRHAPAGSNVSVDHIDTETILLLVAPLVSLPVGLTGSCRLAAEMPQSATHLAGITFEAEEGRVAACTTRLRGNPDAWALGPPSAWQDALVDRRLEGLELGGACELAQCFLDGARTALFDAGTPSVP